MEETEETEETVENKIVKRIGILVTVVSLIMVLGGTVYTAGEMGSQIEKNTKDIEIKSGNIGKLQDSITDYDTRITRVEDGLAHCTENVKGNKITVREVKEEFHDKTLRYFLNKNDKQDKTIEDVRIRVRALESKK